MAHMEQPLERPVHEPPSMTRLRIGAQIRAARRHASLKQAELALAVGVSQRAISGWECGHASPDVDKWIEIAEATRDQEMLDLRSLAATFEVSHRKPGTVVQEPLTGFRDLFPRSDHLTLVT